MTINHTFAVTLSLVVLSGAAQADHGNPWATADDTVLSKNHDANQAKSVGTPGEDEMRGALTRAARGKLDDPQSNRGASGAGKGGGKGGRR
ncbi:hypothetical protein [Antarctobacter sp.]|uniref:hypothetical protein n=1 Tax=Antarctobacter sp. TaxID=1872577 RepID=UPI002B26C46B|nr:hypothetical protein [Antarctobacter sp.]